MAPKGAECLAVGFHPNTSLSQSCSAGAPWGWCCPPRWRTANVPRGGWDL